MTAAAAAPRIVLLELNEVPFRILDDFAAANPGSHLARLLPRSSQFSTHAADDPAGIPHGALSPWITWPTVHRGVEHARHGVTHLGQDLSEVDRRYPPLWRLLTAAGVESAVFGALHTHPLPPDVERYAFYVPDTFAASEVCHPPQLSAFQAFNLRMARASARNVSTGIDWASARNLLLALPKLGIRAETLVQVARQLAEERLRPWRRVRRRTFQSVLGFDVFWRQLRRTRPRFATFFSNHVASAMHRYWAATYPHEYERFDFDAEWISHFRDEIGFAMQVADGWLGRLVAWTEATPGAALLATSSMGQAATRAHRVTTQLYVRDVDRFFAALGLRAGEWVRQPAMEPDLNVKVVAEREEALRERLDGLVIDGKPVRYDPRGEGFFSIIFGQSNLGDRPDAIELGGMARSPESLGLENTEVDEQGGSTAFHIPEGHLLLYEPHAERPRDSARREVSTLEIAPFVLRQLGVPAPPYMVETGPLLTRS